MTFASPERRNPRLNILIALTSWAALLFALILIRMSPSIGNVQDNSFYDVPTSYQTCAIDADCQIVSTSCSGGCQQGTVSKNSAESFEKERLSYCKKFPEVVYHCKPSFFKASCVNDRCTLTLPSSTEKDQ